MTAYKEFRYKDDDPEWQDDRWDDVYTVLRHEQTSGGSLTNVDFDVRWIFNAHEPSMSFVIYESEIDRYIEILNWIKDNKEEK